MKKNNKEKLFGLMKRLDESFTPLKESGESGSDWSFITEGVETSVYGLETIIKDKDVTYTPTSKLSVYWHIEPEFRGWGIKSLIIIIDKIEGAVKFEYFDDQSDRDIEDGFNVEDLNIDWEYQINYNFRSDETYFPSIAPTNIDLYFDLQNTKNVCEIDFI